MYAVILEIKKKHYYTDLEYQELFIREYLHEFEELEEARKYLATKGSKVLETITAVDGRADVVMEYRIVES